MQKFQEILSEAAQLKETQLKNQRKNYESLPDYIKAGLNYSKKYQILRRQHYMIQMTMSQKLKKQGNTMFKQQRYNEAMSKYEEALAIFRYIKARTYDNMKDQDLSYEFYSLPESQVKYKEEFETQLIALYLNICSCLTKANKKADAIHSAEEALKIKETAKGYYKKAQAYLQYINRSTQDIKVGFFFLNRCYEISKDPSIIQEMHKIKKQIEDEKDKEKKWFKFMFDKNSKQQTDIQKPALTAQKPPTEPERKETPRINKELQAQIEQGLPTEKQGDKLERTKQKLSKFTYLELTEDEWIEGYQGQYISKHGSKIYSIIQLFGYKEYLGQYRALLAHCLECKKESDISKRRDNYKKYFQWLQNHPIDKIAKYLERYALQTKWIKEQRELKANVSPKVEQIYAKQPQQVANQEEEQPQKLIKISLDPQVQENSTQPAIVSEVQTILQKPSKVTTAQTTEESEPEAEESPVGVEKGSNIKLWSFLIAFIVIITIKFIL